MKKFSVRFASIIIALAVMLTPALSCSASSTDSFENLMKYLQFNEEHNFSNSIDVTMDEATKEICDRIDEASPLDLELLVGNLPKLQPIARFFSGVLGINTPEFHKKLNDAAMEYYHTGNDTAGLFLQLAGVFIGVLDSMEIHLEPTKENESQFILNLNYLDGVEQIHIPSIYYDSQTGEVYGRSDKGIADIGYNFNLEDMLVYAPNDCWMRDTGFCVEYDILANGLGMFDYDTRRFYFEYGDKEWLIQAWKGNYVISNGAEIGVYNRDKIKFGTYYDVVTDKERLDMSISLYRSGDLLFSTEKKPTWWANGFQLSDEIYEADELTLCGEITFENEEMLQAFVNAVQNERHNDVKFSVNGLTVSVEW